MAGAAAPRQAKEIPDTASVDETVAGNIAMFGCIASSLSLPEERRPNKGLDRSAGGDYEALDGRHPATVGRGPVETVLRPTEVERVLCERECYLNQTASSA